MYLGTSTTIVWRPSNSSHEAIFLLKRKKTFWEDEATVSDGRATMKW